MIEKIQEIQDAFFDIPFDNSAYQNNAFVVAAQITPERAFRAIGLRITAKLRALNEALFSAKKLEVDILELEEKISAAYTPKFERMRAEIDLEQKRSNEWMTKKLIRDAEVEVSTLYSAFKSLPKFTREQFELGEERHFVERLLRQEAGATGSQEALLNMNTDLVALTDGTMGTSNLKLTAQVNQFIAKQLEDKAPQ